MVYALECISRADGPRHLSRNVGGHLRPREVAEHCKGNGERGVEVSSRDVARGEDNDHHSQACARCVPNQGLCAIVLLVYDGGCCRAKDKDKCAHEFCSKLP